MSTAIRTTKRTRWDVARWLEYGGRLHRAIHLMDQVGRRLPPTLGWKTRDTDVLLAVRQSVEIALVKMERVIVEHFGGRWEDVPAPINRFPQQWFDRPGVRPRPWTRRPGKTSRADWIRFGAAMEEAKSLLRACSVEFSHQCRGRDRGPHLAALGKAIAWLDKGECRLDALARAQHPDWLADVRAEIAIASDVLERPTTGPQPPPHPEAIGALLVRLGDLRREEQALLAEMEGHP